MAVTHTTRRRSDERNTVDGNRYLARPLTIFLPRGVEEPEAERCAVTITWPTMWRTCTRWELSSELWVLELIKMMHWEIVRF